MIDNTIQTTPVSVIMTAYNSEKTIGEAIDSIIKQTFTDFEFIIVDDGSNDRTPDIIRSYSDKRIHYTPQTHLGRIKSLNHAVKLSKGQYIANMDSDDIALPKRLEKQVAHLESHPEIGLLGSCGIEMNEVTGVEREIHLPLNDSDIHVSMAHFCPFIHTSVMLRKSVLDEVGIYNERLTGSEDPELWVRIAQKYEVANLPDFMVKKRIHTDQFFGDTKESDRFINEARICWQASRKLSLPIHIQLNAFLFYLYASTPLIFRNVIKKITPNGLRNRSIEPRKGWTIK